MLIVYNNLIKYLDYSVTRSASALSKREIIGSKLGPHRFIAKDVKSFTYYCYVRCATLIKGGMPWPQTGAIKYNVNLGIPDKGRAIKGLVVCNNSDLEPFDLQNGLALGCYQPSPEVLIVFIAKDFIRPTAALSDAQH